MRSMMFFAAIAAILLLVGCSSHEPTAPTVTGNAEPVCQGIPPEVQHLLDNLGVTGSDIPSEESRSSGSTPSSADEPYDVYSVTFVWGSLLNAITPSNALPLVDWSGSFTVSQNGIISATRPIAFETGQDYLLPVTTPRMSAWVSKTSGDFDGINFIVRLPKNSLFPSAGAVTFATSPFTLQLTKRQLFWFSAYYQISNTTGIVVHSQWLPPSDTLAHGLMTGHWIKANLSGDSGNFNGLWLDQNNNPAGVFSGIFWTTSNGQRLFSGSVSGYYTDQVIAYLSGTWYYDDPRLCPICGSGHGRFFGSFRYVSGDTGGGMIGGEFGSLSLSPDQLDLPLSGYWAEIGCPAASVTDNHSY